MMFRLVVAVLCLVPLATLGQNTCPSTTCTSDEVQILSTNTLDANTHFYIGGMFGMHERGPSPYECGKIRPKGIINMEAFFWAIQRYSQQIYPNNEVLVGGFAMDSCSRAERTIEQLLSFETCRFKYSGITPRNTVAFVGPDTSEEAMRTASLLRDMNRTQVSHAATSPDLSSTEYNYFLRTVPSDANDAEIMVRLMKEKALKYVIALYEDTPYGRSLFHSFQMKAQAMQICIVHHQMLPSEGDTAAYSALIANLDRLRTTHYIAVIGKADSARMLLTLVEANMPGEFTFIGTSEWGTNPAVTQDLESARNSITMKLDTAAYNDAAEFDDFWSYFLNRKPTQTGGRPWFRQFWESTFNCSFLDNSCDPNTQSLADLMFMPDVYKYVPYTLKAVRAIISGVRTSSTTYCTSIHLCSNLLNLDTRGQKLYEGISSASVGGIPFFQSNGDAAISANRFKVYQSNVTHYQEIYEYNPQNPNNNGFSSLGTSLVVRPSACPNSPCLECNETVVTTTTTASTTTTMARPASTVDPKVAMDALVSQLFTRNQEFTGIYRDQEREAEDKMTRFEKGHKWIIAIGVLAGLGILSVVIFEIYILYKLMGTKLGNQWRTMWLGQLLLFSIFLCYLVLFAYLPVPTKATCGITRFGVGVSYAMCFAVLLVKLMVLLTSKSSADTLIPGDNMDSPNYLRGIYQFLMFVFVVGVQVVIAIQWLIQVPPDAVQVTANNGDMVWICNHYTWSLDNGWSNMTLFVRSEFENHIISLTYVMFLILITTIVAMKAHGIITNHRESIFIGVAAGFSIPVWVAWGLVGGLNKEHPFAQEFGDACIAFGLFITATLILFSMFLPKVRQLVNMGVEGIYLEDDRDTYYAGSVIMAPPSYKSRPNSVYMSNGGYSEPVIIGDEKATYLKHPGSVYSAPVYTVQRGSVRGSGKVLQMTGELTGKHPRDSTSRRPASEIGYATTGYAYRKSQSESGGTLRKSSSARDLGAL